MSSKKNRPPPPPPPPPRKAKGKKGQVTSREEMMQRLEEAKAPTGLAKRMARGNKKSHDQASSGEAAVSSSPSTPSAQSASVPMMITNAMRKRLAEEAGLSESQVKKLTPQDAHKILGNIPKSAPAKTPNTQVLPPSSSSTAKTAAASQPKAKAKAKASSGRSSSAPTSMAGPAIGGVIGGMVALVGAGYYFFDEEDEDSPLNTVVKMIRGSGPDVGLGAESEMTLEEYEATQKKNDDFQKLLDEVKKKNKQAAELKKAQGPPSMFDLPGGTTTSSSDKTGENDASAGEQEHKRELTMMEKLEQAKRRGEKAGVSKQELAMAARKRAAEARAKALEEKLKKQREAASAADATVQEPSVASSTGLSLETAAPGRDPSGLEMPDWMKNEKRRATGARSNGSLADSSSSSGSRTDIKSRTPEPIVAAKRTQKEALLDGFQALLEAKREEERAYKARFNGGGSSLFGGPTRGRNGRRRDQAKPAPAMLQKFRDDKAKIKENIKKVKKEIAQERKNE